MKRLESLLYIASSRLLGLAAFPLLSAEAQLCIAFLSLTFAASLQALGGARLPATLRRGPPVISYRGLP
jgi:hypothetical protein